MTILVPWDPGPELTAFNNVIWEFKQQYGVQVVIENSRDPVLQLNAALSAGDPPDVVDLPSPAAVYQYKGHGLRSLTINLSSYAQPWRGLAELGTNKTVYAVPVKADIKGLLWDNKSFLWPPPSNWAALEKLSKYGTPWCLGLASGPASGWPGADWVAQILLSMHSVGTYESWLAGSSNVSWTSSDVQDAWNMWGNLMRDGAGISGGVQMALTTSFNDATDEIASGGCGLEHGALSATGLTPTAGYDFVQFPSISGTASPILVSGDFMTLFTNNPNAMKLLSFLAKYQTQKLWVNQDGAYAFSADQMVKPASYPPGAQQSIASLFQSTDGTMLCFGADDMMLPDVSTVFERAVLYYVNRPSSLRVLLQGIQQTQHEFGPSPLANSACAQP